MKTYKTFIISGIFVIMLCLITIPKAFAQHPSEDPTWQLVFNEEFDSLGINAINFNQADWRCNTYEVYDHKRDSCLPPFQTHRTKDNSNILFDTTGTGKLTIRTQRDTNTIYSYSGCDSTWGMHEFYYTSAAWLRSNYRFKYGYFEVRCRLPYLEADETNYGVGPNFWLYENPDSAGGICYSEIDVFEFLFKEENLGPSFPIGDKHRYSCCSHFKYCTEEHLTSMGQEFVDGISFTEFHTFAALWTPTEIKYYVDNVLYFTSTNHPSEMVPLSIILDVNLPTNLYLPIQYTLLPYDYEIDYVKVWQPRANCDSSITCNFSAATYDNSIVNDVSIGGSGCTAIVNNTENVSFKAAEYIEFNQGFSVEPGGTMSAEITNCFTPVLNWWLPTKTSPEDEIPQGLIDKLFYPWEE